LVTGATGFVGKALIQVLKRKKRQITVLSRKQKSKEVLFQGIQWIQEDLRNHIDPIKLKGINQIYHLAGEFNDPEKMVDVNLGGTKNLLQAAKKAGVQRWIQLSSVGVYGKQSDQITTEDTAPAPDNKYEKTKLASDRLVAKVCRKGRIRYCILRPSNVVGAEMRNRSVFELIEAVRKKKFFFIGPKGAVATFVHVDDVARALIACQGAPDGGIYNLSSDCSWEELVEQIALEVGVSKPHYRIPEFPVRATIKLLEERVALPLTQTRLDALTRRCGYSCYRIMKELKFRFSKPMPNGIGDLIK